MSRLDLRISNKLSKTVIQSFYSLIYIIIINLQIAFPFESSSLKFIIITIIMIIIIIIKNTSTI